MIGHQRSLVVLAIVVGAGLTLIGQAGSGATDRSIPARELERVTDAVLESPPPDDWLHWRRTPDGWGYSPLDQINRQNVKNLQVVWSSPLDASSLTQPTPLVHDGVMFVPRTPGIVQALDAVTGRSLWEYRKTYEASPNYTWSARTRSLAIYGDKVFVATPDAHLVAVDAKSGAEVWDHKVADYKLGYRYTSGPIIAKGKLIAGMTGCERYKNDVCFISAHDPETGKELWRTSTIARPGEPGGDSWGNLPLNRRAGGDVWIAGTFDPKANLVYWSASQAKPWARVSRKTDGDALYTNSTLALNPDTGKMVWYHQFLPGETHDLDEAFENVLVDYDGRSSLFKMGKIGILWELDRKTGKFVAAHDLGYQNIVELNGENGTVKYRPEMVPQLNVEIEFCPGMGGVRNWPSMAYHPATRALYIPGRLGCQKSRFTEVKTDNVGDFHFYGNLPLTGQIPLARPEHPAFPGERGLIVAMDAKSGKVLWKQSSASTSSTSALTTGGGLVVVGFGDGSVYFNDVSNGQILFQPRFPGDAPRGSPISYAVNGRQYVAVPMVSALRVFALP